MFVNINVHSYYTFLSSFLSPKEIVAFAVKYQTKVAALTDVNHLFAAMEFFQECISNNVKPLIGLEINYNNSNYVFFAKNNAGYLELVALSSQILDNTNANLDFAFTANDNVIAVHKDGLPLILRCTTYSADQKEPNRIALHTAKLNEDDEVNSLSILEAIQNNIFLADVVERNLPSDYYSLWSPAKGDKTFDKVALANLAKLIDVCSVDLLAIKTKQMCYPLPHGYKNNKEFLIQLCVEGLQSIGINVKNKQFDVYSERLEKEIGIIDYFGFIDYFLIIWDLVKFAHQQNVLIGPGRGSVSGSLVAYALKITCIDPIKNNLLFERFLNPERISMPDIDLDVMDLRREEIFDYLRSKYGDKNVAMISVFQHIKPKTAVRDAGRILHFELRMVDAIAKEIRNDEQDLNNLAERLKKNNIYSSSLPSTGGEFDLSYHGYELLLKVAAKLIGLPRQIGTHAAGVVIASDQLGSVVPTLRNQNNWLQTQFSYHFLEQSGLVKIDILGLRNLSILSSALNSVIDNKNVSDLDELSKIPLNDSTTMQMLTQGFTYGIFQLESPQMTKLITRVKPKKIEDISMVISLYRPGPMSSIDTFIANAKNQSTIKFVNDQLRDILLPTNGIILYQEQIIAIVKRVAKFSDAKADVFRWAISKKQSQIIKKMRNEFILAAENNNFTSIEAVKIYNYISNFADYGFNHSHAFAYALLIYWMAYIKAHWPLFFFATLFTFSSLPNDFETKYAKEIKKFQIRFLLPSINKSFVNIVVEDHALRLGLSDIRGVDSKVITKIIDQRKLMPQQRFPSSEMVINFLQGEKVDKQTILKLIYAGAFDEFDTDRSVHLHLCEELADRPYKMKTKYVVRKKIQPISYFQNSSSSILSASEMLDKQTELLNVSPDLIIKENLNKTK